MAGGQRAPLLNDGDSECRADYVTTVGVHDTARRPCPGSRLSLAAQRQGR